MGFDKHSLYLHLSLSTRLAEESAKNITKEGGLAVRGRELETNPVPSDRSLTHLPP